MQIRHVTVADRPLLLHALPKGEERLAVTTPERVAQREDGAVRARVRHPDVRLRHHIRKHPHLPAAKAAVAVYLLGGDSEDLRHVDGLRVVDRLDAVRKGVGGPAERVELGRDEYDGALASDQAGLPADCQHLLGATGFDRRAHHVKRQVRHAKVVREGGADHWGGWHLLLCRRRGGLLCRRLGKASIR